MTPATTAAADRRRRASAGRRRPAWAEIDLGAIAHNVGVLRRLVEPSALWAVVKADAYGHGAVPVARTALSAGASGVAVALVDEGIELREGGVDASSPVLVLSEPCDDAFEPLVEAGLVATLYSPGGVARAAAAAERVGRVQPVHLKVDTGMHRVGADPADVLALAQAVTSVPWLSLDGLWTHLAVADGGSDEDRDFTALQLARFAEVTAALSAAGITPPVLHVANSAGAIVTPAARFDLVRCGIAVYGELPGAAVADAFAAQGAAPLRPALSLKAQVSAVRRLAAGERPSYGRLRPLPTDSVVATVPIGYADGLPRALLGGGYQVLIGGRRRPLAGAVTMDQIMVDCGPDGSVAPGDEVVLLGRQGEDEVSASEWATRLGTISYEVLCGIGPRVPRVHLEPA